MTTRAQRFTAMETFTRLRAANVPMWVTTDQATRMSGGALALAGEGINLSTLAVMAAERGITLNPLTEV